ncbi:hypothetical protein [Blastopirellula marina]|uniref:Uncharacterized protein n=1 Tax=Blastopirellula marina DSM 3645 TaxID=314230 RepID=A3ZY62_9BACT|nr:hypothetical protein [Blastopirellula marina]EAQ78533.1 hypothetical protein DSM3645_26659 [Blastopirellula marina DSM 3645]
MNPRPPIPPESSGQALRVKLRQVTRRYREVAALAAAAWGLLAALGVLLISVWLDLAFELTSVWRAAVPGIAAIVGLTLTIVLIYQRFRSFTPAKAARLVDETAQARGMVISGWDLQQADAGRTRGNFRATAGLAQLAIANAGVLAKHISLRQAVPWKPAARPWGIVLVMTLLVAMVALFASQFAAGQWRRFAHPWDDAPPAFYLLLKVTPGDADVRYGDSLDIFVESATTPLEDVELVLVRAEQEERVPMFRDNDGSYRAVLTRLMDPAEYYVRAFRARSEKHRIRILTAPEIESVQVVVTPPEYAGGIGRYRGALPRAGVAGLPGTQVQFTATSQRPLAGGTLAVFSGDQIQTMELKPSAEHPEMVAGIWTIQTAGRFELRVRDIDGQESRESVAGTITLIADQRPFVRILKPQPKSLATPAAHLPIELAAEDDYGVSRFSLYRSLNGSRPLPLDIPVLTPAPTNKVETIYLPLAAYGLESGDEIKLFARVEDNHPDPAQSAETPVVTVRIISQQEFEQMLRQREGLNVLMSKYRQAQRMLEKLRQKARELQEKNANKKGLIPKEDKAAAEELARQLREAAQALAKAAKHTLPYDVDQQLTPKLAELIQRLEQAADNLERSLKRLVDMSQIAELNAELAELSALLGQQSDLYGESAMAPLEQLEQVMPILVGVSRFQQLVKAQRDLAERLAAIHGKDGEDNPALKARMRDLQAEQKGLRVELDSLLNDLQDAVENLPAGERFDKMRKNVTDFVTLLRESDAAAEMSQCEQGLAEFTGTKAHQHAVRAAEILEQFQNDSNNSAEQAQQFLVAIPGLGQSLSNTAGQVLGEMGLGAGQAGRSASNRGKVGLYGDMPSMAEMNEPGSAGTAAVGGENPDLPTMLDLMTPGAASGGGLGEVPLRYRRRVSEYFRRLSAEIQQSEEIQEEPSP